MIAAALAISMYVELLAILVLTFIAIWAKSWQLGATAGALILVLVVTFFFFGLAEYEIE